MIRRLVLLALLAAAAASAVVHVWAPFAEPRPARADAIVVLAGSQARLPVALRLWRDGVAPTLVVSQAGPEDPQRARLCADPPRAVVCFAADPYSTRGEAEAVAQLARRHGWRSLAVVTSRFHLFRTRLLFRRCTDARLALVPAPIAWWRWALAIPAEWAKLGVALTVQRDC